MSNVKLFSKKSSINSAKKIIAIAVIAYSASFSANAELTYTIQSTGVLPGGESSSAQAINNKGQVTGGSYIPGGSQAYIWQNGVLTALPDLAGGGTYGEGYDINDQGVVVGYGTDAAGSHAVRWENGYATKLLPLSPGHSTYVPGINNNGIAVGNSGNSSIDKEAAVWVSNAAVKLSGLNESNSEVVTAINDKNQIVGQYDVNPDAAYIQRQAFVWQNGKVTQLGTLIGAGESMATDINNKGQVVGNSDSFHPQKRAVLWQNGEIVDLGIVNSRAEAINENSQVIGSINNGNDGGFIWTEKDGYKNLNDLFGLNGYDKWLLLDAMDINEKGQIVGRGFNPNGIVNGYVLTVTSSNWDAGNGKWDDAENWEMGFKPSELQNTTIQSDSFATVSGPENDTLVRTLTVGGGTGISILKLNGGDIATVDGPLNIEKNGVLTGHGQFLGNAVNRGTIKADQLRMESVFNEKDGVIEGNGTIQANIENSGEIRVGKNEKLKLVGDVHANNGKVEVVNGELDIKGQFINSANFVGSQNTSIIDGHNAILRFQDGLTNATTVALTGEQNQIIGDVKNTETGKIITTGGAKTIFHDDVINDGEIRSSLESDSVFLGSVSGNGVFTGEGHTYFEGDLRPGHSPGHLEVHGNVTFGDNSLLVMEIGGYGRGTDYDSFDVFGGTFALDGDLKIEWYNNFAPTAGDVFTLILADMFTGDFDAVILPQVAGLQFNLLRDATSIKLAVASTSQVPVPASAWLMGSGLIGLTSIARRRCMS